MTKTEFEKEVLKQMKLLDLTREEAEELVADDFEVDKMSLKEVQSDLTEEQKKAIKSATKTTSQDAKKTPKKPRERKVDEEKINIISLLGEFMATQLFDFVEIVKPEREISFKIGENDYSLTLTKHRKPKK